jgi:MoxR-like ATPase
MIALGISPRGALHISAAARARAFLYGRDYVIDEDVCAVFSDVCAHRVILSAPATMNRMDARDVLEELCKSVKLPHSVSG